jgi:nucleoporin POM152
MVANPALPEGVQPLVPERLLDVPSQRLYYLSLGLLLQVSMAFSLKICARSLFI